MVIAMVMVPWPVVDIKAWIGRVDTWLREWPLRTGRVCPACGARALVGHGLVVRWAADVREVRANAPSAAGGIAVLEDERALVLGMRELGRLATAWMVVLNLPGRGRGALAADE